MTSALVDLRNRFAVDGWECWDGPDPEPDERGCIWVWETISGWHGGIAPRVSPIDNPVGDGILDTYAVPLGARTIEIAGTIVAPSRGALQDAMDRMAAVLTSSARRADLIVDEFAREPPLSRSCPVRLAGPTLVERTGPVTAKFSMSLISSTPARYSTTTHTITMTPYAAGEGRVYNLVPPRHYGALGNSGIADVYNAGNYISWPVIEFIGGEDPTISLVGVDHLQYLGNLNPYTHVVLDSAARTVRESGSADRRRYLSATSQWFALAPGWNRLFFDTKTTAGGSTGGQAVVRWRDAWS